MTVLESRAVRDNNGIDTFERSLVYAALMLRASNTSLASNPVDARTGAEKKNIYYNAVRINAKFDAVNALGIDSTLTLSLKIPYNNQSALKQGGNFLENLGVYGNVPPDAFLLKANPSVPNLFPLPTEPLWVNSLERLAGWSATNLVGGFVSLNGKVVPPISVTFSEEDSPSPNLLINALLKLNLAVYLEKNNLIAAITSQVRSGHWADAVATLETLRHLPQEQITPYQTRFVVAENDSYRRDPILIASDDGFKLIRSTGSTATDPGAWVRDGNGGWYSSLGSQAIRGINFKGTWRDTAAYDINDVVLFNGSSWRAVATSRDVVPSATVTAWFLLAARGAQGERGLRGEVGLAGAVGATGGRGVTPRGAWGSTLAYAVDDLVVYEGSAWKAIQASIGANPRESPTRWELFVAKGDKGETGSQGTPGAGITIRGAWDTATPYLVNDAVFYGGSTWRALFGSTGVTPQQSSAQWTLVAAKGDTGATGASGAAGATGTTGAQGNQGVQGSPGVDATVAVGSVSTLPPGTAASVSNSGTASHALLNFGVPSGASGFSPVRAAVSGSTPSLAPGASARISLDIARYAQIYSLATSAPARVRLYQDLDAANEDTGREPGTYPGSNSGLLSEVLTDASQLTWSLTKTPFAINQKPAPALDFPVLVTNNGTLTSPITITYSFLVLEK